MNPLTTAAYPLGEEMKSDVFSGRVWLSRVIDAQNPVHLPMAHVTFAPGCVNNWHRHPGGQVLIVTGGVGFCQVRGKPVRVLREGDVEICQPGEEHWHGASAGTAFSHLAIGTNPGSPAVEWLEPVDAETLAQAEEALMAGDQLTFPREASVAVRKVYYRNRVGLLLAGDLYLPKTLDLTQAHPAIIVGHPYGGVKEQCAGLYAQEMARRGFVALAFDLSYAGESEGVPRQTVSAETYAEDFSASVDFLGTQPFVDRSKIGVIGICGSGGFSLSAAAVDPRIAAIATVSMYDMGAATRGTNPEAMKTALQNFAELRWTEAANPLQAPTKRYGTPEVLPEGAPAFAKEFFDYYRGRAVHPNYKGQLLTSMPSLMNFDPFLHIADISPRPILFVFGEKAHSRGYSEAAYARAAEPKQELIVPDATHVDLYDNRAKIPFDGLEAFFTKAFAKEATK